MPTWSETLAALRDGNLDARDPVARLVVGANAFAWEQGAEQLGRFGGAGDPVARPAVHASVEERAPWFDIADDVTQLAGPVPRFGQHEPSNEEPA